jgi:hypothetical protein
MNVYDEYRLIKLIGTLPSIKKAEKDYFIQAFKIKADN